MNRHEYQDSMRFLTNRDNEKLLSDRTDRDCYSLKLKTSIPHEAGVWVEKLFNTNTNKMFLKISSMGFPTGHYAKPELLILFNKLEKVIFDFLDELAEQNDDNTCFDSEIWEKKKRKRSKNND